MMRNGSSPNSLSFLTLLLAVLAGFILFLIVSGTIWAVASGRFSRRVSSSASETRSLFAGGKKNPVSSEVMASDPNGKTAIFGEIGILRAPTADKKPVTIVVSPFMPYPSDDLAFQEELVKKTRSMRTFILGWFHSRSLKDITSLGESGVKAAIVEGLNELLVLGQFDTVYFDEYMVIE
jgi:flagellar basal body-associated protein FliL